MITEIPSEPYFFLVYNSQGLRVGEYSGEQFVSSTYQNQSLPRWINIVVCDVDTSGTSFYITHSDTFIKTGSKMSGQSDGCPPFHVLGPAWPKSLKKRIKESLTGIAENTGLNYEELKEKYTKLK